MWKFVQLCKSEEIADRFSANSLSSGVKMSRIIAIEPRTAAQSEPQLISICDATCYEVDGTDAK